MVIIASKEGQFANRVMHFAHIASFCQRNGLNLYHPFFHEFLPFFPSLKEQKKVHVLKESGVTGFIMKLFLLFVKLLIKLKIKNLGFLEVVYYDRYDQEAPVFDLSAPGFEKRTRNRILILYGWLFRDVNHFRNHYTFIQKLFAIDENYLAVARPLIAHYKSENDVLVGVHIRRGDYRHFENGRWFYENSVYIEKMQSIQRQFENQGKKVGFILCSNEPLDLEEFTGLTVYSSPQPFIIDFIMLSKSDYIIGPPSTFSALASFFGNNKLQFIQNKEQSLTIKDFRMPTYEL